MELFTTLRIKSTIEFEYKNGNRGRAILVPQVTEASFPRQEKKMKWTESLMEHVSETNDAAQWLSHFIGKNMKGISLLP